MRRLDRSATPRRGGALLLALVVVGTVAALSSAYLMLSSAVTRRQTSDVDSQRAFYIAEAGLAEAFTGLRVGKTGQIASLAAPAVYGQGALWVDAEVLDNGDVRLESTALCAGGRAALGLVVRRTEQPLGFFSDEDLVIDDVLLVDGFDSEDGAYEEQVVETTKQLTIDEKSDLLNIDKENQILFYEGLFYRWTAVNKKTYTYDHVLDHTTLVGLDEYDDYDLQADDFFDGDDDFKDDEYEAILKYFALLDPTVPASTGWGGGERDDDDEWEGSGYALDSAQFGTWSSTPTSSTTPSGSTTPALPSAFDRTTGAGGLIGSNGSISFTSGGAPVEIYGDVVPGPNTVVSTSGALVTGDTEPRKEAVRLPAVEVPALALAGPITHSSAIPMIVSPSAVGFERIEVAPDAELVLRGPSTVVVGELVLTPGALLTLDTTDGAVELFITSELDMQPGSEVTTGNRAQDVSIQVAAPFEVALEAASRFHGTVYAPRSEVRVGGEFEVFGGIVARRLDLAPGARLHFDNAGFDALPRIVSWRIVEIPTGVRSGFIDPFRQLGVAAGDLRPLHESHDLTGVVLDITYKDVAGIERDYTGPEADFDWSAVGEVVDSGRTGGEYAYDSHWWDWMSAWSSWTSGWGSWGSGSNSGTGSWGSGSGSWGSGSWGSGSWGNGQ